VLGRQDPCRRTALAANQYRPCAGDWRLPWARARHIANGRQNTLTHRNRIPARNASLTQLGQECPVIG
jgi:hypothetical protein